MNKIVPWLSVVMLTCSPYLPVYSDSVNSEAYDMKTVAKIDIQMQNLSPGSSLDPKAILSRMKTKVGNPFSEYTFDEDLKTLAVDYDRVEPVMHVENGQLYITIQLWARPMIRSIHWVGNNQITTKTLQKELGIKENSIFNRQNFNKAFNKVKEYYIKKGYFESQLHYVVSLDHKTNTIDIEVIVHEGRAGKVGDITFRGFSKEEESKILEMIYTKKYNFFLSWFTGTGIFNEEAVEQDKLTIIDLLQNEGYADAKVNIQVIEAKSSQKVNVIITADKGQIFHFGRVTFTGNHLFTDQQIEAMFLIHPDDTYSPEKMRQTAQNIKDLYGRIGHIDANVYFDALLVENQPIYNVQYEIEEGRKYKIGLIHIVGNEQTHAKVILRESLLTPGETFDTARLKATQSRLENMGYFKNVNVYAVRSQDDQNLGDNYRDVYIEVEEGTTGSANLFFGFSTAEDIFGGLDLSETNFNYKGLGEVFTKGPTAIRGGGEYAHARFSVGAKQRSYLISWLTPYFCDSLWRVGFDINKSFSQLQSHDYEINTIGGSIYASYPLNAYWTYGAKYRIKTADISVDHDVSAAERKLAKSNNLISGVGTSLVFDSTDSAVKPRNGFRSTLEAEIAGIGGNVFYARFAYINSYYTALWSKGTMKYRCDFRFIEPIGKTHDPNKIPVSERFFLGGDTSVRGYKPFDLGPRFSNGDPKGGISSSLLSIEYNQAIIKGLDLFVFADAGSVTLKPFSIRKYNMSYGIGTRLDVMNRFPMTFGLGFPVNPDSHKQIRRFFFMMGSQF